MNAMSRLINALPVVGGKKQRSVDAGRVTQDAARKDGLLSGTTLAARGEVRSHLFVTQIIVAVLFFIVIFLLREHTRVVNEFIRNGYVVIELDKGRARAINAADFRYTATDEEIQAIAMEMVVNLFEADSTNVGERFPAARKWMSAKMLNQFESKLAWKADEIKQLEFYARLENRRIEQDSKNRFRVLVSGKLGRYRLGTNYPLSSGPIAFEIVLIPLPARTLDNPSAVVVDEVNELTGDFKLQGNSLQDADQGTDRPSNAQPTDTTGNADEKRVSPFSDQSDAGKQQPHDGKESPAIGRSAQPVKGKR